MAFGQLDCSREPCALMATPAEQRQFSSTVPRASHAESVDVMWQTLWFVVISTHFAQTWAALRTSRRLAGLPGAAGSAPAPQCVGRHECSSRPECCCFSCYIYPLAQQVARQIRLNLAADKWIQIDMAMKSVQAQKRSQHAYGWMRDKAA